MLHFLLHAFKAAWRERIALFWPFWLATTVAGAMLVVWIIPKRSVSPDPTTPRAKHNWSRSAMFAVAFLTILLTCYIVGSLVWEDFAYYDNSMFTMQTLIGHDINPGIWPDQGRFFPFGHQEYNVLRHLTSSVLGYHSFRILVLVLLAGILLVLDNEISIPQRVALLTLLLLTPSIITSFWGLIYPESNAVFWIACLAWSVKRFEHARSIAWAVAAMISTQFALYYKETVPLLLVAFTVGRLLLRCWKAPQGGWDFSRLRDPESRLDICLAVMVAPFFLFYLAAMYPNFRTHYAETFRLPMEQVLRSYLKLDLAVWALLAVVLVRIVLILVRKVTPSVFWDGLAIGGVGYFTGYLYLHMYSAYYLAPADLIAVLYLGHLAFLSADRWGTAAKAGALALLLLIVTQDLSLSAFRMYERKNVIHAKVEMAWAIKARYDSGEQNIRLFFPAARPYWIMEFAAYLNYVGVPVDGIQAESAVKKNVQIAGTTIPENGRCVSFREFTCHVAKTPESGDLIVVLPDDFTYRPEFSASAQESGETLVSYSPYPSIPASIRPIVNRLHVVSPTFPYTALPERWLKASVTVWK
jgi:hypothetical protein